MAAQILTRRGTGVPVDTTLANGEMAVDTAGFGGLYVGDATTNTVKLKPEWVEHVTDSDINAVSLYGNLVGDSGSSELRFYSESQVPLGRVGAYNGANKDLYVTGFDATSGLNLGAGGRLVDINISSDGIITHNALNVASGGHIFEIAGTPVVRINEAGSLLVNGGVPGQVAVLQTDGTVVFGQSTGSTLR